MILSPETYELFFSFDVPALMLSKTLNHTDQNAAADQLRDLRPEAREQALSQAERFFRINLKVEIDGKRQTPEIELPSFEPGPLGRLGDAESDFQVRIAGAIPGDSRRLQLAPGRAFGVLELEAFNPAGSLLRRETLPGGMESEPIAIPDERDGPTASRATPGATVSVGTPFLLGLRGLAAEGGATLLFLAALLALAPGWRPVSGQFAAFIAACLLTLGLAGRGYLHVPGGVIEPLAVGTAGLLALENLIVDRLRVWRPSVTFAFGGIHGIALAGPFASATAGQGSASSRPGLALLVYATAAAAGLLLLAAGGWGLLEMIRRGSGKPKSYRRPVSGLILGIAICWAGLRVFGA